MQADNGLAGPLALMADMSQDFAASRDLEDTLRRALARISDHVGAEGGALFLLDEGATNLNCHACVGPIDITGLTLQADQGIVGRSVQNNIPEIVRDVERDPNFHKTVDDKTGFTTRSILCAPMAVKDKRIGAIELVNKKGGDGLFSRADLQVLQVLSSSAGMAILNARMAEALVEQERTRHELELAAEIQRGLLPEAGSDDFPVAGVNVPARMVSGDFYDFFTLEDGRICFAIGDVSGKGMNAALLMAKTASVFRCLGRTVHEPGRLLSLINREVCETTTRGMFVTMAAGIFNPASGRARLANAGHEPALLLRADGTAERFEADSPPLGISPLLVPEHAFPEVEIDLTGGTLYLFTDGVTEGTVEDGSALGSEGFQRMAGRGRERPLAERLAAISALLARPGATLHDDVTILAVEDRGGDRADVFAPTAISGERLVKLSFPARPDRLKLVRSAVSEAARICGMGDETVLDVVLAVDEACQNVIRHAYKNSGEGLVALEIHRTADEMTILLRDYAEPVDVSKIKPRDLDDIRPGGLGTHFIREVMDSVEFLPTPPDGGNLLRMVKRIG
ncbi:MAG: SpoIIE family protein phosphatase [Magnetospirillum sp. WYHS-4]